MNPLQITEYTITTAAGIGRNANWQSLVQSKTGLKPCQFYDVKDSLQTWVGEINQIENVQLPEHLQAFDCRNNRLCELGLQQDGFMQAVTNAVDKYGASRVAVFMGTSTSGIHQTELAYIESAQQNQLQLPSWYDYKHTHNVYSVGEYVRQRLELAGISDVISTACSSSAKVFASAHRVIELGLCDAAVVGGVDSLCLTTLYGFSALQVVATDICKPSDANRQGLSLAEAAGFALVERVSDTDKPKLLGYGESSDAYHMSSPHPEGAGAQAAMQAALNRAAVSASQIDYVNLHGTGTPANDLAESKAICEVFDDIPASSSKGWTGHTLGAAGIVEAAISLLCIANNRVLQSLNTETKDPNIAANICLEPIDTPVNYVLSNSFGFGGSNCSLVFGG